MMSETLEAAGRVVGVRQGTISSAFSDPLNADHVELALMVDEKTDAFASAGVALASSWLRMQSDVTAQAMALAGVVMSGRPPTPKVTRAMADRQRRIGNAALAGSIQALRPIHAAATANARRLKPRKAKRALA